MSDRDVMAEHSTFLHYEVDAPGPGAPARFGLVVYYRHESGVVLATALENLRYRHQFKLVDGLPLDAEPFEPAENTPECANLDAWTDSCDTTLQAIVSKRTEEPAAMLH